MDSLSRVFSRIEEIQKQINSLNNFNPKIKKQEVKTDEMSSQTETTTDGKNLPDNKDFQKELEKSISENNMNNKPLNDKVPYKEVIEKAAQKYNLSPNLINALIKQESNYDPYAVSNKGALGLMQLLPSTAKDMGIEHVFSPEENIDGGSKYLSQLMNSYNNNIVKALSAYNAGSENVDNNKAFQFKETNDYVKNIIYNYMKNKEK